MDDIDDRSARSSGEIAFPSIFHFSSDENDIPEGRSFTRLIYSLAVLSTRASFIFKPTISAKCLGSASHPKATQEKLEAMAPHTLLNVAGRIYPHRIPTRVKQRSLGSFCDNFTRPK
jgi:hypothetical protein